MRKTFTLLIIVLSTMLLTVHNATASTSEQTTTKAEMLLSVDLSPGMVAVTVDKSIIVDPILPTLEKAEIGFVQMYWAEGKQVRPPDAQYFVILTVAADTLTLVDINKLTLQDDTGDVGLLSPAECIHTCWTEISVLAFNGVWQTWQTNYNARVVNDAKNKRMYTYFRSFRV